MKFTDSDITNPRASSFITFADNSYYSCSEMSFLTCAIISASSSAQSTRLSGESPAARRMATLRTPPRTSYRFGRCQVASQDNESSSASTPSTSGHLSALSIEEISKRCSSVFERYDFLSAGIGALAVTGVCVSHGQDPGTALSITAASTVVALVVNDIFFEK